MEKAKKQILTIKYRFSTQLYNDINVNYLML